MRESTLRKLSETRYAVTLEPDEVAEVREALGARQYTCKACGKVGMREDMRLVFKNLGGGYTEAETYCKSECKS